MNYPLITEYIESIKAAEDNFDQLKNLRPVLDNNGQPIMTGGNFAVVFKMKDVDTGKIHAVKCFLKEQEGRAEAYRQITEELENVSSAYLIPIKYLDKELFVDSGSSDENEFPVLLMDWVEGQTLDKYVREHIDDKYVLSLFAYQFSCMAMWLLSQPLAHGDLKPDNIIVKNDGTLVLVDYDGMFVPAMRGQKARELGSPDFRHPSRTEDIFDEHIDDFSLISILLSLKAIVLKPDLLVQYGASDRLLLSEKDYRYINNSDFLHTEFPSVDKELNRLYSLFLFCYVEGSLPNALYQSFNLSCPELEKDYNISDLIKLANNNNVLSQYELGICYLEGKSVNKNIEEALKWIRKAADLGYSKAIEELGFCYINGVGVEKDYDRALELFSMVEPNYNRENICHLMELKVLALNGLGKHKEMLSTIVEFVKEGKGCVKCNVKYYDKKKRCCPWMLYKLGNCYFKGIGVEKDYKKAIEWYTLSAEQGNADGQYILGLCNYGGIGVEKDYKKAVEWFTLSAELGLAAGQCKLGLCYYEGNGVEKDNKKAVEWYEKAAGQGNSKAQSLLGECYFNGNGVEQDYKKAFEWYEKAAEQGDSVAQLTLSKCYASGHGVAQDNKKAVEYIKKVAEQGNISAQLLLGQTYWYGLGVEQDPIKAVEYFKKAARQGDKTAGIELKRLIEENEKYGLRNVWTNECSIKLRHKINRLYNTNQDIYEFGIDCENVICKRIKSEETLISITLPATIRHIGRESFKDCQCLYDVIMPANVISIGDGAFLGCNHLYKIIIPNDVISIGDRAFEGCGNLRSITIPDSVIIFGEYILRDCGLLEEIIIPFGKRKDYEKRFPEHKDKFVERIKGWTVKSKRDFDSSEIAAIDSAIVVESKYGLSVRFNMNSGGYAAGDHVFIPLCKNSTLSVGDIVDLKTAKLNTLYHDGKDDIYIVEA